MPREISNETRKQAQELRASGKSYEEISNALKVSMSWCRHNLTDIKKSKQPTKYVVYIAHDGDNAVYVGQGVEHRYKHVNSGCSHVYELNKDHFNKIEYQMEVLVIDDKELAEELEEIFIAMFAPKYNKRLPCCK